MNQGSLTYDMLSMVETTPIVNDFGKNVEERFGTPPEYMRTGIEPNSFEEFLRTLRLKPEGAQVKFYDGKVKPNNNIYVSVVDLPISTKNIQTNSNAVLRLKAEYLFQQKQYEKLVFKTKNNKHSFIEFANGDQSKEKFLEFLDVVMDEINTTDFCKQLVSIKINDLKIGDVFVQKNIPNGHAVIVVDIAVNKQGQKVFLLAQSFSPAQEIQILSNPTRDDLSPWYELKEGPLLTPEWRFMTSDLMRFNDL